ncbi:uncharacterized protein UTRI_06250 [Ustilago trichophora]|uniref:Uncharacterized protein n=1 Tax=Ustilago trichophora TaxID=86804 RepID=A0A5C3EIG4_9BASI|nr:uncharacterized protein UTRI_06250 [Ustilago trichophora]
MTSFLLISIFILLPCLAASYPAGSSYAVDPLNDEARRRDGSNDLDGSFASRLSQMGVRSPIVTRVRGSPINEQSLVQEIQSSEGQTRFINLGKGAFGSKTLGLAVQVKPNVAATEANGKKTFAILTLAPHEGPVSVGGAQKTFYHHHFVTVQGASDLEKKMGAVRQAERHDMDAWDQGRKVLSAQDLPSELNRIGYAVRHGV